jgi:MoaA/NifB/PqqE/SkfB family radical SAM enzyme
VVVWNCTRTCNLACRHCYSDSDAKIYDQLSSGEARALISDAAGMGSPAFLFSGGEPLIRPDLLELIAHARSHGLPVTLSSNGTLIDDDVARKLADLEVRYVGISLDGIGDVHDTFRGRKGAYDHAIRGIRALRKVGVKVGIRITPVPLIGTHAR